MTVRDHRWLYAWGLGSVALGAASLLVPLYAVGLGADPFELGLLAAVAAFLGAPGAIVWGRLADRTRNRRGVVVSSLAAVALLLGLVTLPAFRSVGAVIGVNAFVWLAFAAAGPVLTLLVVADVPESRWGDEIALLNGYQGYGWAAGLLLGVLWSTTVGRVVGALTAQRWLFVALAVLTAVAAALLAVWMPAPSDRRVDRVDPKRVAQALSVGRRGVRGATFAFNPNRLYWSTRGLHPRTLADRFTATLSTYFLGVTLFFTGFAAFFAPLPLFLTGVGFSGDAVFGLYLVSSVASAVFYGVAGRLSGRYDLRELQTVAVGSRAFSMPLVAVAGTALGAGLLGTLVAGGLFALVGLSWAVIAVTAGTIVSRLAPERLRGEALGVYAALSAFAGGVGSVAGGVIASGVGFTTAFAAAGAVVLLGAGVVGATRAISTRTGLAAVVGDD